MNLTLVCWEGSFNGIEATWLRWATLDGTILATDAELEQQRAEQERQKAEQEKLRAEQEKLRADRAEAQVIQIAKTLLQTGMDAAQVSQMTGLSIDLLSDLP